jgi:hypothetical protein
MIKGHLLPALFIRVHRAMDSTSALAGEALERLGLKSRLRRLIRQA